MHVCVLSCFSCVWLCDPMDSSPPGSSVHGILQARILEWVAIPFSRGSCQPRDQTQVSCITNRFFIVRATGKPILFMCSVAQSCPTLWNSMDCRLPAASVHGISQARILEWVAIPSSRGSSQSRDQSWVSCIAGGFVTESADDWL